jgi:hypothetical protein
LSTHHPLCPTLIAESDARNWMTDVTSQCNNSGRRKCQVIKSPRAHFVA